MVSLTPNKFRRRRINPFLTLSNLSHWNNGLTLQVANVSFSLMRTVAGLSLVLPIAHDIPCQAKSQTIVHWPSLRPCDDKFISSSVHVYSVWYSSDRHLLLPGLFFGVFFPWGNSWLVIAPTSLVHHAITRLRRVKACSWT